MADDTGLQAQIYAIEQTAYGQDCRHKNAANTALIDQHNKQVEQLSNHPWWRFW